MNTSYNTVAEIVNDSDSVFSNTMIELLHEICDGHNHNVDAEEIITALQELEAAEDDDFTLDFDGNEYRIIRQSAIWDIYVEEIKETVNDCYDLKLDNIPSFIAFEIDWEQTAKNAYVDGYGHQFSSYDGSEYETKEFYIFRTN